MFISCSIVANILITVLECSLNSMSRLEGVVPHFISVNDVSGVPVCILMHTFLTSNGLCLKKLIKKEETV